jgi:hypothetical protein
MCKTILFVRHAHVYYYVGEVALYDEFGKLR